MNTNVLQRSQLTFIFIREEVSSPNLGRPLFILGVLTYISRAVDPGFGHDTPSTHSLILLFFLRSIVLQVIGPVADLL